MRRRTLLRTVSGTLAVSLAGCTSNIDQDNSPTPTSDTSTSPTPTSAKPSDARQRTVMLESQDEVPDTHQVSINVDVLEPAITNSHTARIRLTTINEGPARSLSVGPDQCNLFNRNRAGSDDPAGLWLYQPEETEYLERKGERWVPDRPPSQPRSFAAYGCTPRFYESGESVQTEFVVWDDYRVDGYLKPGTYRWEEDIRIWEDTKARDSDTPSTTFTWGFSLAVERGD